VLNIVKIKYPKNPPFKIQVLDDSRFLICAGISKQSKGARNRLGIGLSYRPARLHMLTELVPWNRFLGYKKVKKFGLRLHMLAELIPWDRVLGSLKV
jgi:hypothetical protein